MSLKWVKIELRRSKHETACLRRGYNSLLKPANAQVMTTVFLWLHQSGADVLRDMESQWSQPWNWSEHRGVKCFDTHCTCPSMHSTHKYSERDKRVPRWKGNLRILVKQQGLTFHAQGSNIQLPQNRMLIQRLCNNKATSSVCHLAHVDIPIIQVSIIHLIWLHFLPGWWFPGTFRSR